MSSLISLPIVVLEIETGDKHEIETLDVLRAFADEFWDILDEDFTFTDAAGRPVTVTESFLRGDDDGLVLGGDDLTRKT